MEQVKKLVDAGSTISGAVREALKQRGLTVKEFAAKHGLARSEVNHHINATRRPTESTIAALVAELGGIESEWRVLLWRAGEPEGATTEARQ